MVNKTKKIRIGPAGEIILRIIAAAGIIAIAVAAPNALQLISRSGHKKKRAPKQEVHRNIESLIQNGLIEQQLDKEGNVSLRLSRRGYFETMIRFHPLDARRTKDWDGRWRIIIFDVPNKKGKIRAELRRAVQLYGFHMVQKSVWVYPYPCDDFVLLLKNHLELRNEVLYLTSDTIENDRSLRRIFKLK